jgi:hypothetical protein
MSVRAMPMRLRCPPESSDGIWLMVCDRPTASKTVSTAVSTSCLVMPLRLRTSEIPGFAHRHTIIQRAVLEREADADAQFLQLLFANVRVVMAKYRNLAFIGR